MKIKLTEPKELMALVMIFINFFARSLAGCDPKFLKNLKFAKKHNLNKHQREKKALKDA